MGREDRRLTWVDDPALDISGLVDSLRSEPRLALDTESDPFHRYFEKVCLVQLSTTAEDVVIDPLAVGMPPALRALLEDPARTFVLHGADFDVRSLRRSFDLVVGRIFDTLIAASFVGLHGLGLKALLEAKLGVAIEKTEQRSDWGRRPLSADQRTYATQDTRYLLALADVLTAELEARGRLVWLEEECEGLRRRASVPPEPKAFDTEGWRKLKGAKVLGERGQRALRGLFVWREDLARAADKPPFRVMVNEALVKLAALVDREGAPDTDALRRSKLLPRGMDAARLRATLAVALETPTPPPDRDGQTSAFVPMDPEIKARLERLKGARAQWSANLGLDAGFLASQSLLERVARDDPRDVDALRSVRGMTDWRVATIGVDVLRALHL